MPEVGSTQTPTFKDTLLVMAMALPKCEDYARSLQTVILKGEREQAKSDSLIVNRDSIILEQKGLLSLSDSTITAQEELTAIEKKKRNKARLVAAASIVLNVILIAIIL